MSEKDPTLPILCGVLVFLIVFMLTLASTRVYETWVQLEKARVYSDALRHAVDRVTR